MKKQITIFGLAANPIHIGHVGIAKELVKHCDEVWVSPCYSHMHNKNLIESHHRLAMCRLATQDIPNIQVSSFEIDNRWMSSTYELLCKLRDTFEDTDFSFAIGQDNADHIDQWKNSNKLIAEFKFIIIPRNNLDLLKLPCVSSWYRFDPHVYLYVFKPLHISSTAIRSNLEIYKNALHFEVYRYIKKHHLYV